MSKSNTYKELSSSDILFFIPRISSDKTLFEFFYIQANEEIDKITEKIKVMGRNKE